MGRHITEVNQIENNNYGLSEIRIQVAEIISLLKNTYWTASVIRTEIESKIANARKEIESNTAMAHKELASEIANINNKATLLHTFVSRADNRVEVPAVTKHRFKCNRI